MARPGAPSRIGSREPAELTGTRRDLVEAAIESLGEDGFARTSARAIARRADCNQALIFYHFGSVANLLLAALDETSRRRMERYGDAVAATTGLTELVDVAARIYREDLEAGHIAVLAEMIAGASSAPGFGSEVGARIAPWIAFTEDAVRGALGATPLGQVLPSGDIAYAIVALYLGMELLAHLDDDRGPADSLFAAARSLAALAAPMLPPSVTAEGSPEGSGTRRRRR